MGLAKLILDCLSPRADGCLKTLTRVSDVSVDGKSSSAPADGSHRGEDSEFFSRDYFRFASGAIGVLGYCDAEEGSEGCAGLIFRFPGVVEDVHAQGGADHIGNGCPELLGSSSAVFILLELVVVQDEVGTFS
ncbi:hypothetical protein GU90_07975 [Saccharopolyspora rectivirgula]|uniref:Uncharacterized protein n=1 Tax=Saccharopolyspora rectivirgula TaxID=28042 RepID=A0A073B0B4_9PSEU|nr:hypothetical protein GU90_07975 [Saccharopolyspora rectivirgula]